jgi:hypothetical protein
MTALLERLRSALAPDYEVERELASGGMGMVFLGRDPALDRPVAIKIIRPDLATASAAERFLREARILASLSHPNVIPVHRAGESRGFSYYVMDYLAAETLADRLVRGPLPAAEVLALGSDLLAALDASHRRGILHRDVKPANVFLVEGRAVLGDFGIAKSAAHDGATLTLAGTAMGTPAYMAPEQAAGHELTPAADLYSAGLLLYEALTGRRWPSFGEPEGADWSGVPRALVPIFRRALDLRATARWPDASAFRRALARAGAPAWGRRVTAVSAVIAGIAAVAGVLRVTGVLPLHSTRGSLSIAVRSFRVSGTGAPAWLGDSLAATFVRALGANTDFRVHVAAGADTADALLLDGQATVRGESLAVAVTPASAATPAFRADTTGTLAGWGQAAAGLASQVLLQLWSRENAAIAGDLPLGAAPRTPEGLRAFLRAELLFAHAQWSEAYRAYAVARDVDPSCLICDVRIVDVSRWLGIEAEKARTDRYRAALDSFPPHYRQLIQASLGPPAERIDLLRDLTVRYRGWGFGWFILGDEIFHRGALEGILRADALAPLQQAAVLRPDFAPIWEHLAWVAIAEGDSAVAADALDHYGQLAAQRDTAAATIGAMLQAGFAWRFAPEPVALAASQQALAQPEVAGWSDLYAGPSYLLTFDVPRATVWLGARFAEGVPRKGLETTGLLAQAYGLVALGRPDSAVAVARRAAERAPERSALFAAELPAALALADPADLSHDYDRIAGPLRAIADETSLAPPKRSRARWMLALLAWRARHGAEGDAARRDFEALERPGRPLGTMLDVVAGPGMHQLPALALSRSPALVTHDSAEAAGDPFYRTLVYLSRADWQVAAQLPERAVRELRWHENNDFAGYPGGLEMEPQAGEVDYAFGTLARWRRARLLDTPGRTGSSTELCRCYAAVARLWGDGEPRYAARADTARQRLATLPCADVR